MTDDSGKTADTTNTEKPAEAKPAKRASSRRNAAAAGREGVRRYTPKQALAEASRRMAAQAPKPRKKRGK